MGFLVGDVNSSNCSFGSVARNEEKQGDCVHFNVENSCDSVHIECKMNTMKAVHRISVSDGNCILWRFIASMVCFEIFSSQIRLRFTLPAWQNPHKIYKHCTTTTESSLCCNDYESRFRYTGVDYKNLTVINVN